MTMKTWQLAIGFLMAGTVAAAGAACKTKGQTEDDGSGGTGATTTTTTGTGTTTTTTTTGTGTTTTTTTGGCAATVGNGDQACEDCAQTYCCTQLVDLGNDPQNQGL